jgi:hypothetical protein
LTSQTPNKAAMVNGRLVQLERGDNAIYISLTRTSTLSITTAGVIVTWQSLIDAGCAASWSGSNITVPVSGYYSLTIKGTLSTKDAIYGDVILNGVEVCSMGTHDGKDAKFRLTATRFYKADDVVQIKLTTKTGTHTLQVVTEDSAGESPICHMVLL